MKKRSDGPAQMLVFKRFVMLFTIGLTIFTASTPFVNTSPAKASGWTGWDSINTIYYNPSQEDPVNKCLQTAAQELDTYLGQMSDRLWAVVTGSDPGGPAVRLEVNSGDPEFSSRGDEASRILADGNGIRVIGKTPLAVRDGAYILLNKLGVRWFFSSDIWTVVPNILVDPGVFDEIHEPSYIWRYDSEPVNDSSMPDLADWRMRNLMGGAAAYAVAHSYYAIMPPTTDFHGNESCYLNNYTASLNADINDSVTTIPLTTVSGFSIGSSNGYEVAWIDNEAIKFTSVNNTTNSLQGCTRGYRSTTPVSHTSSATVYMEPTSAGDYDTWQLDPSNPTVLSKAITYANNYNLGTWSAWGYNDHVPNMAVPVSPNDGASWGSYLTHPVNYGGQPREETQWLTNNVEGLADNVSVATGKTTSVYNYDFYADAPAITFNSSVFVSVATAYDYTQNTDAERITALRHAGAIVGIRDYWDPYQWTTPEYPSMWTPGTWDDIKAWNALGVNIYTTESTDSWGGDGIGYYIATRLLWDSSASYQDLLNDFYHKAFGAAWYPMSRFFQRWYVEGWDVNDYSLALAFQNLAQAEALVANDAACLDRVRFMEYWMRWVWFEYDVNSLTQAQLENFWQLTNMTQSEHIFSYRGPGADDIADSALHSRYPADNPTPITSYPTADNAIAWLNEALDYFNNVCPNTVDADLVGIPDNVTALGNTSYPRLSPQTGRSASAYVITSSVNQVINSSFQTFSPYETATASLYNPDGTLAYSQTIAANREFTAYSFNTTTPGRYRLTVNGGLDVNGLPAAYYDTMNTGGYYLYVPPGTMGIVIQVTAETGNSSLYDPEGNLALALNGSTHLIEGIDNPEPGVWKFVFTAALGVSHFTIYGVPNLYGVDAQYLLVPGMGYTPPAPTNHAPVLAAIGVKSITEGNNLQFTVSATDSENESLTYSALNLPTGASFDPESRTFSWTPNSNQVGTYTVRFSVTDGHLADYENVAITVKAVSPNPPRSGTGGGGGGGGGGGSTGVTNLIDSTTMNGRATTDIVAEDVDKRVKLEIPQDTIVRSSYGQTVSSIMVRPSGESLGPNPGSIPIGTFYSFQPSGTTFNPSAKLVLKYDPEALPAGISEQSLYIGLWDPVNNRWFDLGGTVDTVAKTVSVEVQHLSTYAVMVHARPASFQLSGLTADLNEVYPGAPVTLSVTLTNSGDYAGSYQVDLKLDGAVMESKKVSLEGLDSQVVQFTTSSDAVGGHTAGIGDLTASFTVNKPLAPASFLTSNLAVSPAETITGADVEIYVLVMNSGDLAGTFTVNLNIDNANVAPRDVQLDGGKSELVNFTAAAGPAGQHTVNINGLSAIYTVASPVTTTTEAPEIPMEVSEFQVGPVYGAGTGKIASAEISYRLSGPPDEIAAGGLYLTVYYNGELLEQLPLHWGNQQTSDEVAYTPALGWQPGTYTFLAEFVTEGKTIRSAEQAQLTVAAASATKVVSWRILGIIIGATLAVTVVLVTVVVIRRRDMLRWH